MIVNRISPLGFDVEKEIVLKNGKRMSIKKMVRKLEGIRDNPNVPVCHRQLANYQLQKIEEKFFCSSASKGFSIAAILAVAIVVLVLVLAFL